MLLKFKRVDGEFPGNYTWVLDTENQVAYSEYPDGSQKPPDYPEKFNDMLASAVVAVLGGAWYEVAGLVKSPGEATECGQCGYTLP